MLIFTSFSQSFLHLWQLQSETFLIITEEIFSRLQLKWTEPDTFHLLLETKNFRTGVLEILFGRFFYSDRVFLCDFAEREVISSKVTYVQQVLLFFQKYLKDKGNDLISKNEVFQAQYMKRKCCILKIIENNKLLK